LEKFCQFLALFSLTEKLLGSHTRYGCDYPYWILSHTFLWTKPWRLSMLSAMTSWPSRQQPTSLALG